MKLFFQKSGQGSPLIIMHGLYGSSDNWVNIARSLETMCEVYLLDLRNHGRSGHSEHHSYQDMQNDLLDFLNDQELSNAYILGHSMGGKVAMEFALNHPSRIRGLMVADIAPASFSDLPNGGPQMEFHRNVLKSLLSLDLKLARNLRDIDQMLAPSIKDQRTRQFLLKNIGKEKDSYYWKPNLKALQNSLPEIGKAIDITRYKAVDNFPALFIKGENSSYVQKKDEEDIKKLFPTAKIIGIKNAGHWLHAEQTEVFTSVIKSFLLT